jgi:hypothetical protein
LSLLSRLCSMRTRAIPHRVGTFPAVQHLLNSTANTLFIGFPAHAIISGVIPSSPGAVLLFNHLVAASTSHSCTFVVVPSCGIAHVLSRACIFVGSLEVSFRWLVVRALVLACTADGMGVYSSDVSRVCPSVALTSASSLHSRRT